MLFGTLAVVAVVAGGGARPVPAGAAGAPGADIAPDMLALYRRASATCPGLPFTVLAAVGTVESSNGTSALPGVHAGTNPLGAEGPMQFLPATFAEYALPVPPAGAAPPSPYDPVDAVYAAARLLCANGAVGGADLAGALFAYNHSPRYVAEVLHVAEQLSAAYGP
jgi:soluble lytic murein transglycosylase-like protein